LAKFGTARTHMDEIPHTATGKIQKITLRQQFKDYVLPSVQAAE
jgi:acyl-coenzyme A synthetase/AMP-(fatty) acid ligase